MAPASPTGANGATRAHRVGHHQGVPIDPFSAFEPYGGAVPPERLAGHLLVAAPRLADPNFSRRVVLVLDHGDPGALGVVLDRPGGVAVGELLPQWQELGHRPRRAVHRRTGGPQRADRPGPAGLPGRRPPTGRPSAPRGGGCWSTVTARWGPSTWPRTRPRAGGRSSAPGCSPATPGWDSGQLEAEIDEGSWYVVPAEAADPISADPESLWRRVLRRQGGALALVSGFPEDPAMN